MSAQPAEPALPVPIERSARGVIAALTGRERADFIAAYLAAGPDESDAIVATWWAQAVREAASPTRPGQMTTLFIERIIAGGAIDWDDMREQRGRPGARFIDWAAIDRARLAAGRS